MRKAWGSFLLCSMLVCGSASLCFAIVLIDDRGNWPEDWPKELEPLRQSSRTLGMATGTQENVYEIPIPDRETLERIWPAIVKVRSPGSPLILSRFDSTMKDGLLSSNRPMVRIHAPTNGSSRKADHKLRAGPPWPKEIVGKNGELPEYVVSEEDKDRQFHWVSRDTKQFRGFSYRARVDVELVVDGKIIDLNRIALPNDAKIIDRRFSPK